MAVMEKFYSLTPELLKNAICDIGEMRKAKIRSLNENQLEMAAMMYNIKTTYLFRLSRSEAGTLLTVESGGESETSKQDVAYMLAMLDGMIVN